MQNAHASNWNLPPIDGARVSRIRSIVGVTVGPTTSSAPTTSSVASSMLYMYFPPHLQAKFLASKTEQPVACNTSTCNVPSLHPHMYILTRNPDAVLGSPSKGYLPSFDKLFMIIKKWPMAWLNLYWPAGHYQYMADLTELEK